MKKQGFSSHPNNINKNGRPKGTKNKFTSLKDSFLEAFQEIEKTDVPLFQWALKNRRDFYGLISKMLPTTSKDEVKAIVNVFIKKYSDDEVKEIPKIEEEKK